MELFKLFGTIAINNTEANQSIDETATKASTASNSISSVFKKVGTATVAAVTAASVAVSALVKSSIEGYAEYEQLVGGVEKLYGDSAEKMLAYADNAYKSVGLSANQYMQSATTFSASMLNSLSGDTDKAADMVDLAMQDIADNANTFGKYTVEELAGVYSAIAKGQYSTLDNLQLGFKGTQEGMQALIARANELKIANGEMGDLSIESFADIVEAIHIVQQDMNITGTTANEAAKTISGSANMMKAAWKNMIVGIADDTQDFDKLLGNLVESVATFAGNLMPRIETALKGVAQLIEKIAPMIVEKIPSMVNAILPSLMSAVSSIIQAVVQAISQLIPAVVTIVQNIVQVIIQNLPALIQAGVQLVASLVQGIGQALPQLVPMAVQAVLTVVQAVLTVVQGLISQLPSLLQAGLTLIQGLAQGILQAIPTLVKALPSVINGIVQFLMSAIPQIIQTGVQLLTSLVKNLPQIVNTIVAAIPQIISGLVQALLKGIPDIIKSGVELLTSLIKNLPQIITTILTAIPKIIGDLVKALISNIPQIIQTGVKLLTSLITDLPKIIVELVKAMPQIIKAIVEALAQGVVSMAEVGKMLIEGLWEGMKNLGAWLKDKIVGLANTVTGWFKDLFGIHSPSTVFAGFGKYMVEGLGMGIEENADEAIEPLNDLAERIKDADFGTISPSVHASIDAVSNWKPSKTSVAGEVAESIRVNLKGQYDDLKDELRSMAAMVNEHLTRLYGKNSNVVLDTGTLVGEIAPEMNAELNRIMEWRAGNRAIG